MPRPLKALQYGQLKFKTAGLAVPTSGHEVFQVQFNDADGNTETGFYKPLGPTYPRVLAIIAVAYGILLRMSTGTQVAEDRLVLDDITGEVVGTISYALPGYKPLLCWGESLPTDLQEKELRCPSEETLLLHNYVEMLVADYRSGNNDAHPGNVGIARKDKDDVNSPYVPVIIDHDMRGYKLTEIIKGPRMSSGITEETPGSVVMSKRDFDNFPIINGRTHWPANTMPGNLNMLKRYMSFAQFQGLAKNPVLKAQSGNICFQEQLFNALLKQLLLFDVETLKRWLVDYFADIRLDYLNGELDMGKCQKLSEAYPKLFNTEMDRKPVVDFLMAYFQQEYDEFYSAAAFYLGTPKNASGVPVIGLNQFLRNKPSAFHDILAWAEEQNQRMEQSWDKFDFQKYCRDVEQSERDLQKHKGSIQLASSPKTEYKIEFKSTMPAPPGWFCIAPENRYDMKKLLQRYHQIWRDSHVFMIQEAIFASKSLYKKVSASSMPLSLCKQSEMQSASPVLTCAWDLVEHPTAVEEESLTIDLQEGNFNALKSFIKDLRNVSRTYYLVLCDKLRTEHNLDFVNAVSKVIQDYETKIYQSLNSLHTNKGEFTKIVKALETCYGRMNFQRHLNEEDVELTVKDKHDFSAILQRKHTEPEVMAAALKALFGWAKKVERERLEGAITEIIKLYYEPFYFNLAANRLRAEYVEKFLKISMESGDNKLAFVLSSGGVESTSLNTMLVKHLIPIVLRDNIAVVDVNLMSVSQAIERNEFNDVLYTEQAVKHAKQDPGFTHLYSEFCLSRFHNTMYRWVNCVSKESFKDGLVMPVLKDYEPYSINFLSRKTRGPEVRGFFTHDFSNQQILAFIFSCGNTQTNSFNTLLFTKIVGAMVDSISKNSRAREDKDYQWILDINLKTNNGPFEYFLGSLQRFAKDKSNAFSVKEASVECLSSSTYG